MGLVIAFFTKVHGSSKKQTNNNEMGEKQQTLRINTKEAKVINVANLNYCGIMKSPFQFYSGEFQQELMELSKIFTALRKQYLPWKEGEKFTWNFSKLDKHIKERYCPFYNLQAGIENNKFVSRERFIELWHEDFSNKAAQLQQKEQEKQFKITPEEVEEALKFDLLAFHSLLFKVYQVLDINDAVNLSPEKYLDKYKPYFQQSFLDEKKKLQKFQEGMEQSMADVVFVQQPDQLLIKHLKTFQNKYFISVSNDKDTLIFAKCERFQKYHDPQVQLDRLSEDEKKLLNWNGHTSYMFLDNYFLISGHLNSKKKENQKNVEELKTIMPVLLQKYPHLHIICGMDANSFMGKVNERILMYPDSEFVPTTIKKRTSMQTQTEKAELPVEANKDVILTTLKIHMSHVLLITGEAPHHGSHLPLDQHPFDHFLIFVVVDESQQYKP